MWTILIPNIGEPTSPFLLLDFLTLRKKFPEKEKWMWDKCCIMDICFDTRSCIIWQATKERLAINHKNKEIWGQDPYDWCYVHHNMGYCGSVDTRKFFDHRQQPCNLANFHILSMMITWYCTLSYFFRALTSTCCLMNSLVGWMCVLK